MAKSKTVKAGDAEVEVSLRDRIREYLPKLESRLKATGETIAKIGAGLAGASAVGMGVFTGAAKSFSTAGTELSNLATRTGLAVGTLSELQYAAVRVGASMSDVEEVVSAIRQGKQLELWGSKSAGVIRLLNSDMNALRGEAKRLALDMSTQDASSAVEMANALATSAYLVSTLWREVGSAVAPAVTQAALGMRELIAPAIHLIRNNREIVRVMFVVLMVAAKLGAGLAVLGGVISGAGVALGFLSGAFAPLLIGVAVLTAIGVAAFKFRDVIATALGAVARRIAPVIDAVRTMYGVFSDLIGGVMMSLGSGQFEAAANIAWLGFVAAAWTGIDFFAQALDAGMQYLLAWVPGLQSIIEFASQSFGGIYDAILAGRWDLAGLILMTKLQLVWYQGLDFMLDAWDVFASGIKGVFSGVADFVNRVWHGAVDGIARGIMWIMEKTGMAAEGSMALLEKMQAEAAKARNQPRMADPKEQQQRQQRMMQREERRNQLQQQLSSLESEAGQARQQAGNPTIHSTAEASRLRMLKAIADAKKQFEDYKENIPGPGPQGKPTAVKNSETRGTFTAAAAAIIGGSDNYARDTASNTRVMVRHLAKVADNTVRNGATV